MEDATVSDEFKEIAAKKYKEMGDNTQTEQGGMKFVRMAIPVALIDEVASYYGFFDMVELNTIAIQILHIFMQIEKDGYTTIAAEIKDGKWVSEKNSEGVDVANMHKLSIHDFIANIRIKTAEKLQKEKESSEKNIL